MDLDLLNRRSRDALFQDFDDDDDSEEEEDSEVEVLVGDFQNIHETEPEPEDDFGNKIGSKLSYGSIANEA